MNIIGAKSKVIEKYLKDEDYSKPNISEFFNFLKASGRGAKDSTFRGK